jgi:hypothetical protein
MLEAFRCLFLGPRDPVRRKRPRCLLRLETLEDRCTPANFTVDTLNDTHDTNPGDGNAQDAAVRVSLRAAIEEANALSGTDNIYFDAALTGTIHCDSALEVTSSLAIIGNGSSVITVARSTSALNNFSVFNFSSAANAYLGSR